MQAKFLTISEAIIEKIRSGGLLPGDQIPSENELIGEYKISNTTARKVLLEIESKGWGKRIKGKGTFVLNRSQEHHVLRTLGSIDSTRRGFHDYLLAEGFRPKNIILEKTILKEGFSSEIRGKHYIIQGPVIKIHQLRYADDELMKDETKYISIDACPNIQRLPTEMSHFRIYEEMYHLKISDIKQTLSVKILPPDAPENNFEDESPIPVFILDGVVLLNTNRVVEIEKSFYHGDKYKFSIIANPIYQDGSPSVPHTS